jgi:hypothetical protein
MIKLPPTLTLSSIHSHFGDVTQLDEDHIVLDFSKTSFSDPAASLFLIRWVETARALGLTVTANWGAFEDGPLSDDMSKHSKWMFYNGVSGFRSALETGYVATFTENPRAEGRYVKYQRFDLETFRQKRKEGEDGEARKLVRAFADKLGKQAYPQSPDVPTFSRCLAELLENVVWYAGDEASCFVMSQLRPLSRSEEEAIHQKGHEASKKLEIAIFDDGVGLLSTLRDNAGVDDHASAVEMAVTPGVSSTQGFDRGYGLALLQTAASKGGFMYVATNNDEDEGALVEVTAARARPVAYPLAGTFVGVSILPELVKLEAIDKMLRETAGPSHGTLDIR